MVSSEPECIYLTTKVVNEFRRRSRLQPAAMLVAATTFVRSSACRTLDATSMRSKGPQAKTTAISAARSARPDIGSDAMDRRPVSRAAGQSSGLTSRARFSARPNTIGRRRHS